MVPAFRNLAYTPYALRGALVIATPSGVQDGDKMVAVVARRDTQSTITPSGWTLAPGYPVLIGDTTGFRLNVSLYTRDATSSEPTDYTWDISDLTAQSCGVIYAASGPFGDLVIGEAAAQNGIDGAADISAPSIAVGPDALVAWFGINWNLYGGSQSVPPGSTPTFTQRLKPSDSLNYVADGIYSAGGATGVRTQAGSNATTAEGWFGVMVGFEPDGANPVGAARIYYEMIGARNV